MSFLKYQYHSTYMLEIIDCLRSNARISMRDIAKRTNIPKSTVFDYFSTLDLRFTILLGTQFKRYNGFTKYPEKLPKGYVNTLYKLYGDLYFFSCINKKPNVEIVYKVEEVSKEHEAILSDNHTLGEPVVQIPQR